MVSIGGIIFSKGYGYANLEKGVSVDSTSTVFEYGSISKLFVYAIIMRLVEQGKINLNVDIRAYLPENFLRKIRFDKPITMLDVMNHTIGFEDYLFDIILTDQQKMYPLEQALKERQPEQVYEPGSVLAYSNYAVALLVMAAYIGAILVTKYK